MDAHLSLSSLSPRRWITAWTLRSDSLPHASRVLDLVSRRVRRLHVLPKSPQFINIFGSREGIPHPCPHRRSSSSTVPLRTQWAPAPVVVTARREPTSINNQVSLPRPTHGENAHKKANKLAFAAKWLSPNSRNMCRSCHVISQHDVNDCSIHLGPFFVSFPSVSLSVLLPSSIVLRLDTFALLHNCLPCLRTCQTHLTILSTHSRWLKVFQDRAAFDMHGSGASVDDVTSGSAREPPRPSTTLR